MSHDVTHTLPFNAEHAKAGAPYCCADGTECVIHIWACDNTGQHVGGIRDSLKWESMEWPEDGAAEFPYPDQLTMVMLPLGFVEDKPVFVGDALEWTVSVGGGTTVELLVATPKMRQGHFSDCRWPHQPSTTEEPAKAVYPEFAGDESILDTAYDNTSPDTKGWNDALIRVANAAIRHAIDSQQVVVVGSGWLSPRLAANLRAESDAYYRQVKLLQEQKRLLEQKIAVAESQYDELAGDLTDQLDAARGEAARLQKNALHWERIANETDESLCKAKDGLASARKELTEANLAVANYKAACEGMESDATQLGAAYRSMFDLSNKACRTLIRHGFTDNGGEEWKPPIGFAPGQKREIARLVAQLATMVQP